MKNTTNGHTFIQKMYLVAVPLSQYQVNESNKCHPWGYRATQYDPTGMGHCEGQVMVMEFDMEVCVPDGLDLLEKCVSSLKDKQSKIMAKAHAESQAVQIQIDSMLAIEHIPTT